MDLPNTRLKELLQTLCEPVSNLARDICARDAWDRGQHFIFDPMKEMNELCVCEWLERSKQDAIALTEALGEVIAEIKRIEVLQLEEGESEQIAITKKMQRERWKKERANEN